MRQAATRILVIWFTLAWAAGGILGQKDVQSSAVSVESPDGNYQVYWVDLFRAPGLQARRLIFLVGTVSNRLLFAQPTFQRRTGAVWNIQSTACAIFDAPDNANVYVWVVKKQSDETWSFAKLDVEKAASQVVPTAFAQNPVRMGIGKLSWTSNDTLTAELILNGKPVAVKLPLPTSLEQ